IVTLNAPEISAIPVGTPKLFFSVSIVRGRVPALDRDENPNIKGGIAFLIYVIGLSPTDFINNICTMNIAMIAKYDAIMNNPKSINVAISLVAAFVVINAKIPYGVKRSINVTIRMIIAKMD